MPSAEHRDEQFVTPSGQRLFCQYWLPESAQRRGVVVLCHGYGEHSTRYRDFAHDLSQAGLVACLYDLRGHGRSAGPRAHVGDFTHYLEDQRSFLEHCRAAHPQGPVFLFGHSLGGLITLAHAQQALPDHVRALAVTSPFLALALAVPAWKVFLARRLAGLLPRLAMPNGIEGRMVSHDPQIVRAYDSDPLMCHQATAGWFMATRAAQELYGAHPERITLPTLVLQAGADALASAAASRAFAERLGAARKEYAELDDCYHEVLNEPAHRADATRRIIAWFEQAA